MSDVEPEEEVEEVLTEEFTGFPERDPSLTGEDWDDDEIPENPEGHPQVEHDELGPQE